MLVILPPRTQANPQIRQNVRDFDAEIIQRYFPPHVTSVAVEGVVDAHWYARSRAEMLDVVGLHTRDFVDKHDLFRIREDLTRVGLEEDGQKATSWMTVESNGCRWSDGRHGDYQTKECVIRMQWRRRCTRGSWVCDRFEASSLAGGFIGAPGR